MNGLSQHVTPELTGFLLTLALSLLIGFEREEVRPQKPESFFGGVRTFPLIGLTGYLLVVGFPASAIPFATGLIVLGSLLALSHFAGLTRASMGITTEVSALLTYAIGAATAQRQYWLAVATAVVAVLLLHEKRTLEGLVQRVPRHELGTLVRFLLLTAVILPVVPRVDLTILSINPFKIWLVVVAVSAVSYLSYLLQLRWGESGVIAAGLLGGAYSSTATTVVLARRSKEEPVHARRYAGAILAATGVMYLRLWVLVMVFAGELGRHLTALFWGAGLAAVATGVVLARTRRTTAEADGTPDERHQRSGNPLELTSAITFAGIFVVVLTLTRFVASRFGGTGVLVLAGIMGATDVDPFILGLTQTAGQGVGIGIAAAAVVIAAASNNVMKGIYALVFGYRPAGRLALALLAVWAAATVGLYFLI